MTLRETVTLQNVQVVSYFYSEGWIDIPTYFVSVNNNSKFNSNAHSHLSFRYRGFTWPFRHKLSAAPNDA